ncbi:hypothetical protein K438DRAFT_1758145 [Mycena galopus ATCC 62051]|nr:hypothetical protein K438DRAFT_1758145 [Mycena galopus ATCC 62051]
MYGTLACTPIGWAWRGIRRHPIGVAETESGASVEPLGNSGKALFSFYIREFIALPSTAIVLPRKDGQAESCRAFSLQLGLSTQDNRATHDSTSLSVPGPWAALVILCTSRNSRIPRRHRGKFPHPAFTRSRTESSYLFNAHTHSLHASGDPLRRQIPLNDSPFDTLVNYGTDVYSGTASLSSKQPFFLIRFSGISLILLEPQSFAQGQEYAAPRKR